MEVTPSPCCHVHVLVILKPHLHFKTSFIVSNSSGALFPLTQGGTALVCFAVLHLKGSSAFPTNHPSCFRASHYFWHVFICVEPFRPCLLTCSYMQGRVCADVTVQRSTGRTTRLSQRNAARVGDTLCLNTFLCSSHSVWQKYLFLSLRLKTSNNPGSLLDHFLYQMHCICSPYKANASKLILTKQWMQIHIK